MGIEDRDWYRDELRKRTGYKELAKFRINLGQQQKQTAWTEFWTRAACVIALIVAAAYVARILIR